MADVHRLGHVRRGVIDHERSRPVHRRDAQSRIGDGRRKPLAQTCISQPKIDEPRPSDLRRIAEVGHLEPPDHFGSHVARRSAEPFTQRHGEVRLIIAELRVLAGADHFEQVGRVVDPTGQRVAKTFFQ